MKKLNSSYEGVTFLCRCSTVSVCFCKWWDRCYLRCVVKSYLLTFIEWIIYPSFIVFRFEHVHKIIFLCGNMSYNLFISCRLDVELIFKGAKFHKRNKYLSTIRFWRFKILLTCKIRKIYFKANIHNIFYVRSVSFVPPMWVLEHLNCIIEECQSRNRRIVFLESKDFQWLEITKAFTVSMKWHLEIYNIKRSIDIS